MYKQLKFKYGDKVRIKEGFYGGCIGTVYDYYEAGEKIKYLVVKSVYVEDGGFDCAQPESNLEKYLP